MITKEYKTSEQWHEKFSDTVILDPDGWDRSNWDFSWYEERIDYQEYQSRLAASTVIYKTNTL
jgi:hypothetical protein